MKKGGIMILGIIIGITIYSAILTVLTLYQDNSGYFAVETLDILMAGHVMWTLIGILYIVKMIYKRLPNKRKGQKEYAPKSDKYIKNTVKRIVKNYSKQKYHDDIFDFTMMSGAYNCNDVEGWERLLVKKAMNERINNKFKGLMYHCDKEKTTEEIKKYFIRVTEEYMKEHDFSEWFIMDNKNTELYVISEK